MSFSVCILQSFIENPLVLLVRNLYNQIQYLIFFSSRSPLRDVNNMYNISFKINLESREMVWVLRMLDAIIEDHDSFLSIHMMAYIQL